MVYFYNRNWCPLATVQRAVCLLISSVYSVHCVALACTFLLLANTVTGDRKVRFRGDIRDSEQTICQSNNI